MPYTAQAVDAIEPISDSVWEIVANTGGPNAYNVISGCAITYSVTDMTFDVAEGSVTHNGSTVAVAAQAGEGPLVADPSNPRWTWIGIDSGGNVAMVAGDPAAAPGVPELGDHVALALVLVPAGATIADNITYKLDKRIFRAPAGWQLAGADTAEATTTSTSAVDLVTISGLSIAVDQLVMITGNFRKDASAAQAVDIGLKVNSTVVAEANSGTSIGIGSTTQQVESGLFVVYLTPRSTNYLVGVTGWHTTKVSATGAAATAGAFSPIALTNPVPNAAITSITIRAKNRTASNNVAVKDVYVFVGESP